MTYKRFFAFGCSYTNFIWPTWADIVAHELDIEYHNYGISGIGNVGIMHEVVRADIEYNFNDDDLIMVVWSHWCREDRWLTDRWASFGSVFNSPVYDKQFVKKYWSASNDIIKNSTAIISTNKMLGNKLRFQGHIMPLAKPEMSDKHVEDKTSKQLLEFYMPSLPTGGIFKNNMIYRFDGHPTVGANIEYVHDNILPILEKDKLSTSTLDYFNNIDKKIHKIDSSRNLTKDQRYNRVERYVASLK